MSDLGLEGLLHWLPVGFLAIMILPGIFGQPELAWNRTYGGNKTEQAYSIVPSWDGGYIIGGYTRSFGAVGFDAYILKIDESGEKLWDTLFTGEIIPPNEEGTEQIFSMVLSGDGGFIAVGGTYPNGGTSDVLVLKISSEGTLIWNKTYGGSSFDEGRWIVTAGEDAYLLVGVTHIGGSSEQDLYFIKIDENGEKIWEKAYGHARADGAYGLVGTEDGGFIAAGFSNSFSTDRTSEGYYMLDAYLFKIDLEGNKVWEKTYGGSSWDWAHTIIASGDGGFIVAGKTMSAGAGSADVFLFKIDRDGNLVWNRTYGGSEWDEATSLVPSMDGGYIVAGKTSSFVEGDADERVYVLKVDWEGNKVWEGVFGDSLADSASSIVRTGWDEYIVAGTALYRRPRRSEFYVLRIRDRPYIPIPDTILPLIVSSLFILALHPPRSINTTQKPE